MGMLENFNIQSLHGAYFSATIVFYEVFGRILVRDNGQVYLCQDSLDGSIIQSEFGYKYAWLVVDFEDLADSHVFNLKILPSPIEYHALFREILEKRGPTWSEDGSYSVIPNEVLAKIHSFMEVIKEFDLKNLGK